MGQAGRGTRGGGRVSAPDLTQESVPPADATEAIRAAVHAEFDEVLPYVVEALRRNNAFDEINDRLRVAERRLEARRERPVVVGVHHVLDRIRHLDFDPEIKQALEDDVAGLLTEAGYEETGQVGEVYEPRPP